MVDRSPLDSLIGSTLGNYFLEELIERNEASSVFKARNTHAGTFFRLRVIAVPSDLKPEDRIVYLGRFQQEANQVAGLQHPQILPVVDYAIHNTAGAPRVTSWPYLVSPYFSVTSLSTLLARKGPIDATLAGHYLDYIASALEYAHQQAVLHRNLTTDCIFIHQDVNLLVADFGVMHLLQAGMRFNGSDSRKVAYGMNEASSPAPEQILGHAVDTFTDVYALGAVLYRMLTGHRAFKGNTLEEIFRLHLQAPVPSLSFWRNDLPKALDGVLARAMAKEPAQRYLHPGELANGYHQIIAPNDTQRVPFIVATPPTIRSEQSKRIYSSSGQQEKSANAQAQGRVSMQSAPISRRRALGYIAAGGAAAAAVLAVALFSKNYLGGNTAPASTSSTHSSPANTPIANQTVATSQGNVLAQTSAIPSNSAQTFPIAGQENPGIIVHLSDGRFVAFDSTCTHAGCAVIYSQQDKLLECPCHSAEFDPAKNAAVVQGPATTPLATIKITVNADGTITKG